jgi:thioesterase domain-containing protein
VRCVLSVRPEGPWVLAGLCTGGTIAFEMAQQLERQAMGPCTLVLIDANDVAARRRVGRFALGEARRHWSELKRTLSGSAPPASLGFVLRYVGKLVRLGAFQLGARAALWRGELRVKSLQRRLDRGSPPPPGGHWPSIDEICSHAEREHVVQGRLASEVVLVRATQGNGEPGDEPFAALYSDPLFGWAQRVSGPIRAIDVRGGHYSMFQPPHVQALADVLRSSIRPDAREASPGTSSGPRICAP